ncbi:MAG: DNA alkylation repair protein [Patescibacteria group bacterium]|jgi:3-methyladenine DNA glycosylase AlkD
MSLTEQQILLLLKPCAQAKRKAAEMWYIPSGLEHMGCPIPAMRAIVKKINAQQKQVTWKEYRATLDRIWKSSNNFAVLYVLLLIVESRKKDLDLSDWTILKTWSKKIDNWAHSDSLSSLFAMLLDQFPHKIYPTLVKWNTSKNPWERRLSLVSMICYARSRTHHLPYQKIIALVEPRIRDEHFYVQRAVGWTLRECGTLYPEKTKKFIETHMNDFSSIAWTTATEQWSTKERLVAKGLRKPRAVCYTQKKYGGKKNPRATQI